MLSHSYSFSVVRRRSISLGAIVGGKKHEDSFPQTERLLTDLNDGYVRVDYASSSDESMPPTPTFEVPAIPPVPKLHSLSPLLSLALFADLMRDDPHVIACSEPHWSEDERASSPDPEHSVLPSPWEIPYPLCDAEEIPNPFRDAEPYGDTPRLPPADDDYENENEELCWKHVRVYTPQLIERHSSVIGPAMQAEICLPESAALPIFPTGTKLLLPFAVARRTRSHTRFDGHDSERNSALEPRHELAERPCTSLGIRKSVTTDYLNVSIPDHVIAF